MINFKNLPTFWLNILNVCGGLSLTFSKATGKLAFSKWISFRNVLISAVFYIIKTHLPSLSAYDENFLNEIRNAALNLTIFTQIAAVLFLWFFIIIFVTINVVQFIKRHHSVRFLNDFLAFLKERHESFFAWTNKNRLKKILDLLQLRINFNARWVQPRIQIHHRRNYYLCI